MSILSRTVNDPLADVLHDIWSAHPHFACLSAYIWNRAYLEELIPALHKLMPKCCIVVGGPEAPRMLELISLGCVLVDGPGEGIIAQIVNDPDACSGSVVTGSAPHLRDLPFPYQASDVTDLAGHLVYYEASRGCPFRCSYCLSANDQRNERRFAGTADTARLHVELDILAKLHPRTVKFVDRSFNAAPETARAVWKYLAEVRPECEFHFEIHPGLLKEEDIALLESFGGEGIRFEVGIQSTDDTINAACGRHSDWEYAKKMLNALRERTSVTIHADLLCGLPGQRFASVLDSLDDLATSRPHEIQLGLLKILPSTPMLETAIQRGYQWMDSPPYQVLSTDGMDFEQIFRCQSLARIVNLYWNKQEFVSLWNCLLDMMPASRMFTALLEHHLAHGLPLHSISKSHREEVFKLVTEPFLPASPCFGD